MHVEKNNPYCTYAAIGSILYHIERRYQNHHGWFYMDISSLLSEVKKSEIGCYESLGKKYNYYYYNHKDIGGGEGRGKPQGKNHYSAFAQAPSISICGLLQL